MTTLAATFTSAITRIPGASYAQGLTTAGLGAPDLARARAQHEAYCGMLIELGLHVTVLSPDDAFPDSTFVEDTAIVTARGAMITRPGASSRAGEVVAMRTALEQRFESLAAINAPGTLDGSDVCQIGEHFCIGVSDRTNPDGAQQLSHWLEQLGYTANTIDIRGNAALLHLKSGLTWLGDDVLLIVDALVGHPAIARYRKIVAPAAEAYASNAIRVNDAVVMAKGFPETLALVNANGFRTVTLDVSEFQKMDGGLSCLSIRIP